MHLLALLRNESGLPFYLLVGAAAAIQNVIPIPAADVAVLLAAFLTAAVHSGSLGVFLAAWCGNTGGAAILYLLAHRYRASFPNSWLVRRLLERRRTDEPRKWDVRSVFVGSFLPVRPLLPVYAGLHHIAFWRVVLPLGLAAALWYGGVVALGTTGGQNFDVVARTFARYNRGFSIGALGVAAVAATWWLVRRRSR